MRNEIIIDKDKPHTSASTFHLSCPDDLIQVAPPKWDCACGSCVLFHLDICSTKPLFLEGKVSCSLRVGGRSNEAIESRQIADGASIYAHYFLIRVWCSRCIRLCDCALTSLNCSPCISYILQYLLDTPACTIGFKQVWLSWVSLECPIAMFGRFFLFFQEAHNDETWPTMWEVTHVI